MKKDLKEVVFILDKSGSMCGLEESTIKGFNSMIDEFKSDGGEKIVSTLLFDSKINLIHDRLDIKDVPSLTKEEYFTSGCTALLDAIGFAIKRIDKMHKELKDEFVPESTVVAITTDGYENSSVEYTYNSIHRLIDEKQNEGWKFIFLGANIDVAFEAEKMGIDKRNAKRYKNTVDGVIANYCCMKQMINEDDELSKRKTRKTDKPKLN